MTDPVQPLPSYEDVYADLKRRARAMRPGRHSNTLDTTALVHEGFLKLAHANVSARDRSHLFQLAAMAMRQVLIDHLRERGAQKRGGDQVRIELTDLELPQDDPAEGLTEVLQALTRLQHIDSRLADVFALRAFAGLAFEDIGSMLDCSRSTAQRDFDAGRAYLLERMGA